MSGNEPSDLPVDPGIGAAATDEGGAVRSTPLLGGITAAVVGAVARLATELGLEEIEVQDGEQRIRLRWPAAAVTHAAVAAGASAASVRNMSSSSGSLERSSGATAAGSAAAVGLSAAPVGFSAAAVSFSAAALIRAPMAGTFYRAPAPGQPVFVDAGSAVDLDTVVCIIESMKMMNRVEAERSGRIANVLVSNGDRVQIGQPLFALGA